MKKAFSKNVAKRTACILTAGIMAVSAGLFTGCSKSGQSGNNTAIIDQQEAMKSLAFKVTDVSVDFDMNSGLTSKDGLFYTSTYTSEQNGDSYYSSTNIAVFDASGEVKLSIPIFEQKSDNEYGGIDGSIFVDDSGNISCSVFTGSWDEETGESDDHRYLIKFDSTGKEISRIDISEIVTEKDQEDGKYFSSFLIDSNGYIYISLGQIVRVCDSAGTFLFDTPEPENDDSWFNTLFLTNSGVPAILLNTYTQDKSTCSVKEIDINAKGFGAEHELVTSIYNAYSGSGDYLCYYSSDTGIMGVRADTCQPEQVLNLLNLGVDNRNITDFCINSDGSFVTVGRNYTPTVGSTTVLNVITPVDSSEVKEKKILTLGCFSLDWNVRSDIAEFNKTNEEYTIYATSYSETNDTSDYTAALTKFNNELLAGNVPDILLIDSEMPYDSYASKGLFTDLYELIDNDLDYTRESFMPNILKALEKDGKLYVISPCFNISTFAAKKSLVGDATSITMEKANDILATMPEGATLTSDDLTMSQSSFLSQALAYSNFVDYSNASCSFDTPEFKAILEAAKKYPAEIDYDALYNDNPNYWTEQESACRNNKALLYNVYFNDFDGYTAIRDAYIGEEISLVGFPGNTPEGETSATLYLGTQFAVSDKSKYKEGAWEFIKKILDGAVYEEEYYGYSEITYYAGGGYSSSSTGNNSDVTKTHLVSKYYGLPVLMSQIKALGQQATLPETYIDVNGNEVESDVSYNIDGIDGNTVKVNRITMEEVDQLIEYFSSINRITRTDSQISNIIDEEAASFFNGTKSVDETASLIQSRASIYLSEQY